MADSIPWDEFETKIRWPVPLRDRECGKAPAHGIIIQTKFQHSDRELVEQIAENHICNASMGCQEEIPFDAMA